MTFVESGIMWYPVKLQAIKHEILFKYVPTSTTPITVQLHFEICKTNSSRVKWFKALEQTPQLSM